MAATGPIQITLMPSGATAWDDEGRLGGRSDLPLSERGVVEAVNRARTVLAGDFELVICGPDEASRKTAEYIGSASGAKVRVIDGLAEMDVGLWAGQHLGQLKARCPKACREWSAEPEAIAAPEGESWLAASERICGALASTLRHGRTKVAVIVRPMAHAMLSSWLAERSGRGNGRGAGSPCDVLGDKPEAVRFVIESGRLGASSGVSIGSTAASLGAGVFGMALWGLGSGRS